MRGRKNRAGGSRDDIQTCSESRLQGQVSLWERHLIHRADLLHHAFDKVIEDPQLAVERLDEHLIRLDPHDNFWQNVMPAEDVDPAALRNVELALQLRPEAFAQLSGKP